ncbi:MAG TPA: hypothetical protein DGG94_20615 [Micromonosporaceae bacterium]|nr:hypothetical protein [Micromonosporaceae bacterium]
MAAFVATVPTACTADPPAEKPKQEESALALDVDGCPTQRQAMKGTQGDAPGELISPQDVTWVTLCELAGVNRSPQPPDFGKPRKLTRRVAEMVAVLNRLPDRTAAEARAGRPLPHRYQECEAVDYFANYALSVHYPNRTVTVLLDINCGLVFADGRTRYAMPDPKDSLLALYREQLAIAAPAVVPHGCAAAIDPARLDVTAHEPADGIGRNRGSSDIYLPSPLAAIKLCRYVSADGQLKLAAEKVIRDGLAPVYEQLKKATVPDPGVDCGNPNKAGWQPTNLDVLWVADVTAAVSELRVWRAPCVAVRSIYFDAGLATPELLMQLDRG